MHVKMTTFGYWATLNLCAKDEAIREALMLDVERTPHRALVYAPYAAWKFAYRQLYDVNFGPRGARRVYGKTAVYTALKVINRELNYVDTHPSMQGLGMFDIHTEIFPAWKVEPSPGKPNTYSPYPQPGHQFVVLAPRWQDHPMKLTWWVEEAEDEEFPLLQEKTHLPLWRLNV